MAANLVRCILRVGETTLPVAIVAPINVVYGTGMVIRPACQEDLTSIWSIIGPVIQAGETYTLDPAIGEADALAYWLGPDRETFVAEDDGRVIGTYYMRPNQAG